MSSFPPPAPAPPPGFAPPPTPYKQPTSLWVAIGAGAALVIGAFLPWISASSVLGGISVNGIDGDGKITAVAGGVGAVLLLVAMGQRTRLLCFLAAVAGVVGGAVGLYDYNDAQNRVRDANNSSNLVHASIGVGLYLTVVGAVVLVVASLHVASIWKRATTSSVQP